MALWTITTSIVIVFILCRIFWLEGQVEDLRQRIRLQEIDLDCLEHWNKAALGLAPSCSGPFTTTGGFGHVFTTGMVDGTMPLTETSEDLNGSRESLLRLVEKDADDGTGDA